jgi:hypothetical protein
LFRQEALRSSAPRSRRERGSDATPLPRSAPSPDAHDRRREPNASESPLSFARANQSLTRFSGGIGKTGSVGIEYGLASLM